MFTARKTPPKFGFKVLREVFGETNSLWLIDIWSERTNEDCKFLSKKKKKKKMGREAGAEEIWIIEVLLLGLHIVCWILETERLAE